MKNLFRTLTAAAAFACLVTSAPSLGAQEPATPVQTTVAPIDEARKLGDVERLRQLAAANDDAAALTARAEIAALDGNIEAAHRIASDAFEKARDEDVRGRALVVASRAAFELGRGEEAEEKLRAFLTEHPQAHRVRLELGLILLRRGATSEGELVLDAFSSFYNNRLLKTSEELTTLSKAMAALGSFEDANFAMQQAVEEEPRNAAALVHWGDLLLSKYNTADAEVVYEEALALNPDHVDALVGLARVELETTNDYAKMRDHLQKAERLAPRHVEMLLTQAEVDVADSDCDGARARANAVLENRPRNLEALTFLAVCDYLDDDRPAFEKRKRRVLELNPRYARVLTETARFAVRVHRYEEAVELNREALRVVPDYGPALVELGIGLSRIGKEDEALQVFQRAYQIDPYNVRAFNMVELYEDEMPEYEFTSFERFKVRAHRSEADAIAAIVGPVVAEALRVFDGKYGFEPASDYLAVEVFPNPTTFAVRSVGLPHVSPHGICFGKVVVSRSPRDGNFNWRQVIWHELAHVYHIQMSRSRVPRWFTEGLAEYETNVKDESWARYHDRELAAALNGDGLRGVLELSQGFTHARSMEEIVRAYHQSSLVIHFIVEKWGFGVIPQMLRAWGEFKQTPDVLASVLKTDPAAFDEQFSDWLSSRYRNFSKQLTIDLASIGSPDELEESVREDPSDALRWAHLSVARYRTGDAVNADLAMAQAVKAGPEAPEVNAIAALYFYDRGRLKDAHAHGVKVLDAGRDSYDLRVLLGTASLEIEDPESALVHFNSAVQLWHDGRDAWEGLGRAARALRDDALQARTQRRLFELDQNDPQVARQRTFAAKEAEDWGKTYEGARRWFDVSPFDARAAESLADAALHMERPKEAAHAFRVLAVLRPDESEAILLRAIEALARKGHVAEAKEVAEAARRSDIPEDRIRRALQ